MLSSMIGAMAVLLAVIGLHGVLAYSVSRRTREIGLRVAIGANPSTVATAIIREGLTLTLLGIAAGVSAAYFGARVLRALLFGISETDAFTFIASATLFAVVGALAGVLPARRAARIDPAITLRAE
jgi:putative ABC transport system permease protein